MISARSATQDPACPTANGGAEQAPAVATQVRVITTRVADTDVVDTTEAVEEAPTVQTAAVGKEVEVGPSVEGALTAEMEDRNINLQTR